MSQYQYNASLTSEGNAAAEIAFNAALAAPLPKSRAEKLADQIAVLAKRIAADTAKLAEVQGQLESVDKLEGVTAGSQVTVKLGRADTARIEAGTITGVKTNEDGSRQFKFFYGVGFDSDTVVINEGQIVSVL